MLNNNVSNKQIIQKNINYIAFILGLVLLSNIAVYKYLHLERQHQNNLQLEQEHELFKIFIIDNLILTQDKVKKEDIEKQILYLKEFIKNYIFIPKIPSSKNLNLTNHTHSQYITLQELLDTLANQQYIYNININKKNISSNGIINTNSMIKEYRINSKLICTASIQIDKKSIYEQREMTRFRNKMLFFTIASSIIFIIANILVIYIFSVKRAFEIFISELQLKLDNYINNNANILLFLKTNEEFTLNCYQFYKENNTEINIQNDFINNREYFPISLGFINKNSVNNFYKIKLEQIIVNLKNYFYGYAACFNSNLVLDISNEIEEISMPFEEEVFNQLSISILANILYFNRDRENKKYIRLIFRKNTVSYLSNGFRLDKNLVIRYSEKIFNDTANMYILTFNQICSLLNYYQIKHEIIREDNQTIIKMLFKEQTLCPSNESNTQSQVIQLAKFRQIKKNYE